MIACKYMRLECDREMKRDEMAAHEEDDKLHLHMAMDGIVKFANQTIELERHIQGVRDEKALKFKLIDYQRLKDLNMCVASPPYFMSPNGYKMALDVCAAGCGLSVGTHVSVHAWYLDGEYDAQLKWPFIGKITFTILNQLEDKNHHQKTITLTATDNTQAGSCRGHPLFIPHSALDYDAVNNTQYLKDNTLYFRMSIEPADHKPWLQ